MTYSFFDYEFVTLIYRWLSLFFFFNDPATTEIYTLSLHDALPIRGVTGASMRRQAEPANEPLTAPPRVVSSRGHRWVDGTADDLGGRLDRHPAAGDLALQEVQQRGELGGRDRIGAALLAQVVEHQLHPAAAVGFRVGHVQLERRELRGLLGVGRRARGVRVGPPP